MRKKAIAIFLLLFLLPIARSSAQFRPHCNVIRVESAKLSNAIRVRIVADGVIDLDFDLDRYANFEKMRAGAPEEEVFFPSTKLSMRIGNARTQVGNFIDISKYPVSHVEISIPPESREGIGIELSLVLYIPGFPYTGEITSITRGNWMWNFGGITLPGVAKIDLRTSPDQRSIIITVIGDRVEAEEPIPRGIPVEERRKDLRISWDGERISVFAMNVDINSFLKGISEKTGLRLLAEEGISRTISMSIRDATIEELLKFLCIGYGLSAMRTEGDAYVLVEGVARGEAPYYASKTAVIPLKYIDAERARGLLPDFLLGFVHPDREGNALVVTASEEIVEKVRRDIERIDIPAPQIMVQGVVVEFKGSREMEIFMDALFEEKRWGVLSPGPGTISVLRADKQESEIQFLLRAFVEKGMARIRAEPSLLLSNGEVGRLFAGEERMIQVMRYEWGGMRGIAIPVSIGTTMRVRPWTGGEEINIGISVETSNIMEVDPLTKLPTISSRKVEGYIRVRDGDTVVVGAFKQSQGLSAKSGIAIPIIGRIPVFGERSSSSELEDNVAVLLKVKIRGI
jgi:hypothetical protein